MNEEIKELLHMTGENMDLYVVTRIEELEQENATLRQQINKMKSCYNCKNIQIIGSCILGLNGCINNNHSGWEGSD